MRPLSYLELLLTPWRYDDARPLQRLAYALEQMYGDGAERSCYLTINGRTALYLILRSLAAEPGDEVIVQSFTCVAAVNPILWAGLRPVYVDIDVSNLGADPASVAARITPCTRAIIVQHTFGLEPHIEPLVTLARSHGLVLIEDRAHTLAATPLYGDGAVLSFGIEKVLSTRAGGALLLNNERLRPVIEREYAALPHMSRAETLRWLLHPLLRIGLRRLPAPTSQRVAHSLERLGILRQAVAPAERHAGWPPGSPARLSGALAAVALSELDGLDANLKHRAAICREYAVALSNAPGLQLLAADELPLLQFPVICATAELRDRLRGELARSGVPVNTWYDPPIFPRGIDLTRLDYRADLTPVAEDIARRILCLPTGRFVTAEYARKIARRLMQGQTG